MNAKIRKTLSTRGKAMKSDFPELTQKEFDQAVYAASTGSNGRYPCMDVVRIEGGYKVL